MAPTNVSPLDSISESPASSFTSSNRSKDSSVNHLLGITNNNNEEEIEDQQLFFVTSYSNFNNLAHGPRGSQAKHTLRTYKFQHDGSLVLLNITGEGSEVLNPAFSRFHPRLNVVYTCTEDIENNGIIIAYDIHCDGSLTEIGRIDAGGTSTCYLTIDREQAHIIACNYWDSTLVIIPLSTETGEFIGPIHNVYDPKCGQKMIAAAKKHGGVNHSNNDASTIAQRQKDPHSHAIVLDPFVGCVAYVPDLGKDVIREIFYNSKAGMLGQEFSALPSGMSSGMPDGPRYIDFHPKLNVAYVVNELSCTIAVFSVDKVLLSEIARATKTGDVSMMDQFKGRSTLKLIQSIKTVPSAFPVTMNTCGRICVHPSGRFVIVSNRGHESVCVYRIKQGSSSSTKDRSTRGTLTQIGFFHTRGETPRHFQFDHSGQFLIVANQDSDSIAVFSFNLTSGEIKYTGNEYRVPSPNFVCCCPTDAAAFVQHRQQQLTLVTKNGGLVVIENLALPTILSNHDSILQNELDCALKEIDGLKMQLKTMST